MNIIHSFSILCSKIGVVWVKVKSAPTLLTRKPVNEPQWEFSWEILSIYPFCLRWLQNYGLLKLEVPIFSSAHIPIVNLAVGIFRISNFDSLFAGPWEKKMNNISFNPGWFVQGCPYVLALFKINLWPHWTDLLPISNFESILKY